jgi:hypothetical protein
LEIWSNLNKKLYNYYSNIYFVVQYVLHIKTRICIVERIQISYFLALSRVARFYATTKQKLIHSFCNALRIRMKINQLHQSLCYTSSTLHKTIWICRYSFNGKVFLIFFCITPHTHKIKKSTVEFRTSKTY